MKKTAIWQTAVCALLFMPVVAFSQKHFAVKANGASALLKKFNSGIEWAATPHISFLLEYDWARKYDSNASLIEIPDEKLYVRTTTIQKCQANKAALVLRHYPNLALQSYFVEGGLWVGRFDTQTEIIEAEQDLHYGFYTTTPASDFREVSRQPSSTSTWRHGGRCGIGIQRCKKMALELSGGIDVNFKKLNPGFLDSEKFITPYFRAMIGLAK